MEKIFRVEYENDGIGGPICSETVLEALDNHFHCTLVVTELPARYLSEGELRKQRNCLLGVVGRLEIELKIERLKVKKLEAEQSVQVVTRYQEVSEPIFIFNQTEKLRRFTPTKGGLRVSYAVVKKTNGVFEFTKLHDTLKAAKAEAERLCRILRIDFYVLKVVGICSTQEAPVKWEEV